ncbi:hypothetical protein [Streptomyces sp. NPDC058297]|uniref:SbtR family transcriptional regulator n=1 Tax=unclassified Streptomyces TaxID=2593676 RepID=UPI0036F143DB
MGNLTRVSRKSGQGAAEAGALRADTDAADVQALAAAIAWVDGQSPPAPDRRTRLLRKMLDGTRPR